MIQRKRILLQTGIFLKQNPGEAHLTVELQQMAADNNTNVFVSKLSRYLSNITGSNAYWHKAKEDLKAIISHVGAPTFFQHQARGSIHCHGVAKLKNDPGLCQLSETALKGYLAEVSLDKAEQSDILELNRYWKEKKLLKLYVNM